MKAVVRVLPFFLCIVLAVAVPSEVRADHPGGTAHINKNLSSPATNTTGSYTVTWNGDGSTQLILQEKQGSGSYLTSYVGTGSSKSYNKSSGTYTYRIRQDICFWGECEYFYTAPVTTVVTLPPTGPTISGPATDTDGTFTVSWNSVSGAIRYEAEQRQNTGSWTSWTQIYAGAGTSVGRSGLSLGRYQYRVRGCSASSASSCGVWSTPYLEVDVLLVPATPTGPATATGNFTVSWSAVAGAASYWLQELEPGGSWTTISNSGLSASISPSANGTHQYRVAACGIPGCGGFSSPVKSVQVTLPPPAPGAISGPSTDADGSFSLSWSAVSSATSYVIQRRLSGGSWSVDIPTTQTLSHSETGRADGVWGYRLKACNTAGCSAGWSPEKIVTVAATPGIPGALTGPSDGLPGDDFTVSWTAATGSVSSYKLEHKTEGASSWTPVTTTALSYIQSSPSVAVYLYRVSACNTVVSFTSCSPPTQTKAVYVNNLENMGLSVPADSLTGAYAVTWTALGRRMLQESSDGINWVTRYDGQDQSKAFSGKSNGTYRYRLVQRNPIPSEYQIGYFYVYSPIETIVVGQIPEPTVDPVTVAGNIPYDTGVTKGGNAFVTVPITPAPGVNGAAPSLAISYSSGRDRQRVDYELPGDVLGYGFSLSGFSSIRRCVKGKPNATSIQIDDGIDLLCLEGEPLVLTNGTYLTPGSEYRTLRESYHKIVMHGTVDASWFEVFTPDGSVMEFGRTDDSRVRAVNYTTINGESSANYSKPYKWSVNRLADAFGNAILYNYFKDEAAGVNHPWYITYGNNNDAEIRFDYVTRDDLAAVQLGPETLRQPLLLHTVRVSLDTKIVRKYRIVSETSPAPEEWRRVDKIQLCGYDENGITSECLLPLDMDWAEPTESLDDLDTYLDSVTDSFGAVTEFVHGIVNESGDQTFVFTERPFGTETVVADTQALSSPPAHNGVKSVVTSVRRSNGLGGWHTTSYAYHGRGLESTKNWGYLGFYGTRITDEQSGIVTYHQYRLDFPYFAETVATKQFDGVYGSHTEVLTDVEVHFDSKTYSWGIGRTTYLPYRKSSVAALLEDGTTMGYTLETNTLNMTASLVSSVTNVASVGSGRSVATAAGSVWGQTAEYSLTGVLRSAETAQTLDNDTTGGDWLIGFADSVTEKMYPGAATGTADQTQTVDYTRWQSTNEVGTTTRFPGDTEYELDTTYSYAANGNLLTQAVSGANAVTSRTVSANNYVDGRYPTFTRNAVSHDTYFSFDHRFGLAKQATDPNSRITSAVYDGFGRVTSQTSSDGVVTTTSYELCTVVACPQVGSIAPVMRVESDSAITPRQRVYLDKLGRVIRGEVESFDGTYSRTDTEYDARGRVDRVSQPYLVGATRYFSDFAYDIRDRATTVSRPNGGSTSIDYVVEAGTGVRVTLTESVNKADGVTALADQVRVSIYDLTGDLVTSIDDSTGKNVKTNYAYYASGLPKTVAVDPDGANLVTSFQFDDAGNRTRLTGPDVGTIDTLYTALNQPRQVTDNLSQVTTMTYDLLGRILTRSDADAQASWTYDPVNGKGFLASRAYGTDFDEDLAYSSDTKIDTITTTLKGGGMTKVYVHDYGFDNNGRLDTIAYPSGIDVQYGYNTRGYLSTLTDIAASPNVTLKTINAADAYGNTTDESYGNGHTTLRGFDAVTGWLESIDTSSGGNVLQDNTYEWQSNGILESRARQVGANSYSEVFQHDGLSRLEQSQTYVNAVLQRTLSSSYDIRGNLSAKTSDVLNDIDVTSYNYTTGSNELASATIGGVSTTFTTDNNGNITRYDRASGEDKFIDWNARNLPTTVVIGSSLSDTTPTAKDEFAYGPDGQRFYKKTSWDDSGTQRVEHTFYVGAFEELITDSSNPSY
ncbi:MAG: SpvB/TcaC N-terminal domain-containing protein, partial [Pseudomonadota bacterium]